MPKIWNQLLWRHKSFGVKNPADFLCNNVPGIPVTPGGKGIWTLTGCRKSELGVCVRQRRGLTLAWGSRHAACTSESDTSNTYRNQTRITNNANYRIHWGKHWNWLGTCSVMVRGCRVELGGKRSFTPGSVVETSKVPVSVREQLSLTGRDTTMNQEKCCTEQQASCRDHKTLVLWWMFSQQKTA